MSEEQCRGARDFTRYDSMTTEGLEKILRLDAEAPMEQESDTELILYVMEVLAKRENKENTGKTAQESWESFQKHYLPQDSEHREHTQKAATNGKTPQPWLRRLIACAAAIVLVLCIPMTAKAFGWKDLWNVVAKWATETFSFVGVEDSVDSEPSPTFRDERATLQEVLSNSQRESDFIPTWVPDGYQLIKIDKKVTPERENYSAFYVDGDRELTIRVQTLISPDSFNVEIEEDVIEVYEASGVKYYIFSNMDKIRVIWATKSYECNVSGDISVDDAKMMIDSIGKG